MSHYLLKVEQLTSWRLINKLAGEIVTARMRISYIILKLITEGKSPRNHMKQGVLINYPNS